MEFEIDEDKKIGMWMTEQYKTQIAHLMSQMPFNIDPNLEVSGAPPTMANSEFLTNKEQGDWAEEIVFNAINQNSQEFIAVKYGRSDSLSAGDIGFADYYQKYQEELNHIGKRPDLLIFKRQNFNPSDFDFNDEEIIKQAVAAIEVRSSSFLSNRYAQFMERRTIEALAECKRVRDTIIETDLAAVLRQKSPEILQMLSNATDSTFKELDFRLRSWSSSPELKKLTDLLRHLKDQIKILHKRDYLSITPKVEDFALVNRWIQRFNVRHYYLQVFFDKAYVIPFKSILEISSDSSKEDVIFSIEEDVKNQRKTTVKINVQVGKEILGRIDMPEHRSALKELDRGRLLFYVTFQGGKGYLDETIFLNEIIHCE